MKIRKATLDDSPVIAELSGQLGYPSNAEDIKERLKLIFETGNQTVLTACLEDKSIVGWIHVFITQRVESHPFAEIGGIVVSEQFRNQGIGKLLMAEAEEWVKQQNVGKIRIRSRPARTDAHGFFKKLDFSKTKEQCVFDKKLI